MQNPSQYLFIPKVVVTRYISRQRKRECVMLLFKPFHAFKPDLFNNTKHAK